MEKQFQLVEGWFFFVVVVLLLFVPQGLFYPFKCPIGELRNVFNNLAQKQGSFLCSVCHRWQFDRAVWHFLFVLLSFCLMDCTHIHFHPDSVPKRKSKPCIDVWDSAYSTFTGSMHAFWSASFKIHACYEALARFKERKKRQSFTCVVRLPRTQLIIIGRPVRCREAQRWFQAGGIIFCERTASMQEENSFLMLTPSKI